MITNKTKLILISSSLVIGIVAVIICINRPSYIDKLETLKETGTLSSQQAQELYKHYLSKLNVPSIGIEITDIHEDIESISPLIVPQLVETYEDTHALSWSRHAAALGLIKADPKQAEEVFMEFIDSKDAEILTLAIVDLAIMKSTKPYDKTVGYSNNPNPEIRRYCAIYFGYIGSPESIELLVNMMKNDPDKNVRSEAINQLQRLGLVPNAGEEGFDEIRDYLYGNNTTTVTIR